jgi:TctA family transporter
MNLLIRIILIGALAFGLQSYFPWYSAIIAALLVELILGKDGSTKFFSGFYGIALVWMALSAYVDFKSESILSIRILEMFKLPPYGSVMVVLTGLLGGLLGGFATTVGGWIREAVKNE